MTMMSNKELQAAFLEALRGMARLQARQEMLECVVRALIVETPPAHSLFWKALHTAKLDLEQRAREARPYTPPEHASDAMALWNVLCAACAPPSEPGKTATQPQA